MKLFGFPDIKRYYLKLIIYTTIVALIPILILSSFVYLGIKRDFRSRLNDATLSYLKQSENMVGIVIKQVDQSINQLIIDSGFNEFENFYNGDYYESVIGGFKDEDLPMLYKYLESKNRVFEKLSVYKSSNNFVDSVYFYDSSKKIILTDKQIQYKYDEFYDTEWFENIIGVNSFPAILDTRSARQWNNKYKDIISIVYKTISEKDYNNFVVINIDAQYLYNNLSENIEDKRGGTFFILSKNNKAIIKDRKDNIYKGIIEGKQLYNYLENNSGIFEQKINDKRYVVNFIENDVLHWRFITAISHNELYAGINYIRNLLAAITVIIIILTLIAIIISSKNMYSPISNIVTFIRRNIRNDEGDSSKEVSLGEIDYISDSIRMVHDNYVDIHNKLEKNLPDYKQSFIHALLQYNNYEYKEIMEKLEFLGIHFDAKEFAVIIVSIEEINNSCILRTKNIIESNLNACFKGIVVNDKNKFAIVINCDKDRFTEIFEFAESLKNELYKEIDVKVSIGVSRLCDNILNLSHAYNEAVEALKYRDISEKYDVIYIDNIQIRNKQFIAYPKERVEVINTHIRAGNKKEALESYNEMVKLLFMNNKYVYYSGIQQISIRFLNSINNAINTLGVELNDIFQYENLYQELLKMDNLQDINMWFSNIISQITDYINSAINEKKGKYLEQINRYLADNLESNITLNTVAEHLRLNPSYVSRMFKECMGKNFIEHLTEYRIEKSKELLVNSKLKVQDICTKMGYSNSYYFIKVFKQYTGLTPGQYRKSYAIGEI
jgi:two-component system, response regulator YesN